MGSKITAIAGGMILGMLILVSCEPFYQKLTVMKKDTLKSFQSVKSSTEKSLADVMQSVEFNTDNALDIINDRIDDLIQFINDLDVSKLKGKSRMALIAMKQKINELKQS